MSSSQTKRLQNYKNRQEEFESQIGALNRLIIKCNQDLKAESNAAKRSILYRQIDNYETEIEELYDRLDNIEEKIRILKSSSSELSFNNYLDNPKNKQELDIKKTLTLYRF